MSRMLWMTCCSQYQPQRPLKPYNTCVDACRTKRMPNANTLRSMLPGLESNERRRYLTTLATRNLKRLVIVSRNN